VRDDGYAQGRSVFKEIAKRSRGGNIVEGVNRIHLISNLRGQNRKLEQTSEETVCCSARNFREANRKTKPMNGSNE